MKINLPIILFLSLLLASCGKTSGNDERIEASGTIEATEVNVSAKVGGQIESMKGREGDWIKYGDTLAIIDHATLELQLRQAHAGWELARIQVESDNRDDQRTADLLRKGSITQKLRDDANTRFRVSKAKMEQARMAMELIRKNISDCYLTAPVGGVIANTNFEPGETVGPGSVLHTISKLDTVEITVYISEKELGYVKLGQPAEIRTDSYNNRVFPGKVVYISSEAEFTPKNIQTKQDRVKQVFGIKIEVPNLDQDLKPGMPADAVIIVKR